MYPEVYGRLMIFSPSLWVVPQIPFQLLHFTEPYGGRIYLYGGQRESDTMVPNLERLKQEMEEQLRTAAVKPVFKLSVDPEGEHNEARWGQEFPRAVRWLFFT
jgi:predicted alpha/beta superfamily hydrolase